MAIDPIIKRTIEGIVRSFEARNPSGGTVLIGGNARHNQTVIDSAKDVAGVVDAYEIQQPGRAGLDLIVTVGPTPTIEISFDAGTNWSNL